MAWTTPKTDWAGERDQDGIYTGDFFEASDFNRILGNVSYLCTAAGVTPVDLPSELSVGDFMSKTTVVNLCSNLIAVDVAVNESTSYTASLLASRFLNYQTLNTIETLCQTLYTALGGS